MEKNSEIVVTSQNNELSFNFQRVDFSDPSTILNYGDEPKDSITAILESTAQISSTADEIQIDEEKIKAISSFDEQLEESERLLDKKDPEIIKKAKDFLTSIGVKKFEKDKHENSYEGKYEAYVQLIKEVQEAVESQKQGALKDLELRKAIVNEMTPYVEQLSVVVETGKEDLEGLRAEIEELKQGPQTEDILYDIEYKNHLADVFNVKINNLETALTSYKQQILAYKLQQNVDMEQVMQNEAYIKDQAPILKAQGSVMAFNYRQKNRIEEITELNKATNATIRKNAAHLTENAEAISDLAVNGGISIDTLQTVQKSLERGANIFRDGKKKQQARIDSDRKIIEEIDKANDEYNNSLKELVNDNSVFAGYIGTSSYKTKLKGTKNVITKR